MMQCIAEVGRHVIPGFSNVNSTLNLPLDGVGLKSSGIIQLMRARAFGVEGDVG